MNNFTAKRDGVCAVSGQPIVAGQTLIGWRDDKIVLAEYAGPTRKALQAAQYLKNQQKTSASDYASIWEREAPAWMTATVEQISNHIDLVWAYAHKHGVQLKWEQVEYGLTPEQIETTAIAKQRYKYNIGDYLPCEARLAATVNGLDIREYFGVYYIAESDMVVGTYADNYGRIHTTGNSLTLHDIIAVRYDSEASAVRAASCVHRVQPASFIDYLYTLA